MTTESPAFLLIDYMLGLDPALLDMFSDVDGVMGRMIFLDGLPFKVNGTAKRALTLANAPGTTPFGTHVYSSNVQIRFYADHDRDAQGAAEVENGLLKAWRMFGPVDVLLNKEEPLKPGDPILQVNRSSPPFESYDMDQDLPYVTVSYDVAVITSSMPV